MNDISAILKHYPNLLSSEAKMQARQKKQRTEQFAGGPPSLENLPTATGGPGLDFFAQLASLLPIPGAQYLPLLASLGLNIADAFHTSDEEREIQAIFDAKKERLLDLRRQARSEFTPAEEQRFTRANEPILNRVAANLAQRGLSQSGIIAQTLAGLEQEQYFRAQDRADAQIPQLEGQVYSLAQEMRAEPGFSEIAGGILQFYAYNQQKGRRDEMDARYEQAIQMLEAVAGEG